jgi:hypothetical protein
MKKACLHLSKLIANLIFYAGMMASSICYASKPYLDDNRVAYISSVLQAFSKTQLQDIFNTYRYISVVDNNNCRSSLSDLRVQCLLSFANKNCKETNRAELKDNCELYSDIIIVNKLSEKTFIDRTERYRILKNADYDHRTVIANRLQQKYARIVTQFSLTEAANCDNKDFNCLAKGLDQFCLDYTNSQSLSWQYCTSAMLWFIGTSKKN